MKGNVNMPIIARDLGAFRGSAPRSFLSNTVDAAPMVRIKDAWSFCTLTCVLTGLFKFQASKLVAGKFSSCPRRYLGAFECPILEVTTKLSSPSSKNSGSHVLRQLSNKADRNWVRLILTSMRD